MKPILTVIIPTRDRAETLVHALKTVTQNKNENLEIIISDNFSGPDVKKVFDDCNDNRVRYIRTSERLGMSEHWDFAIEHATGDWISILGDDDGFLPNTVDRFITLIEKRPKIKAVKSVKSVFRWPADDKNDGILSLVYRKDYKIKKSFKAIKNLMNGSIVEIPTIYTGGFVHRDIINLAKSKTENGKFIQSLNPDVYSGLSILALTEEYILTNESLAIAGSSKFSVSATFRNNVEVKKEKMEFFKESSIKVHPILGNTAVESMQIVIYECFLQAKRFFNFNFEVTTEQQIVIAICQAPKKLKHAVLKYCEELAARNNIDFLPILKKSKLVSLKFTTVKIIRKICRKLNIFGEINKKTIKDNNVRNIYDASLKLHEIINKM